MNTNLKSTKEDIKEYLSGNKHTILTALIIAYRETGNAKYKEDAKILNKMLSDTQQTHYTDINKELEEYSWRQMATGKKAHQEIGI